MSGLPKTAAEFRDWRKGRTLTLEQMNEARRVLDDYAVEPTLDPEVNPKAWGHLHERRRAFFAQFPET